MRHIPGVGDAPEILTGRGITPIYGPRHLDICSVVFRAPVYSLAVTNRAISPLPRSTIPNSDPCKKSVLHCSGDVGTRHPVMDRAFLRGYPSRDTM